MAASATPERDGRHNYGKQDADTNDVPQCFSLVENIKPPWFISFGEISLFHLSAVSCILHFADLVYDNDRGFVCWEVRAVSRKMKALINMFGNSLPFPRVERRKRFRDYWYVAEPIYRKMWPCLNGSACLRRITLNMRL